MLEAISRRPGRKTGRDRAPRFPRAATAPARQAGFVHRTIHTFSEGPGAPDVLQFTGPPANHGVMPENGTRHEALLPFVLASSSKARSALLTAAGIEHEIDPARIDERAVEEAVADAGLEPADLATLLAEAKALDVSARHPGRLVLGADQTLGLDGTVVHKAENMEEARRRLLAFSGCSHELNSALALARDGETVWRHVSVAHMHVRPLTPGFIGRYLAQAGSGILSSVGCYQVEGAGIQLFDRIDGDHFTVIGLPLLPLLAELRKQGLAE